MCNLWREYLLYFLNGENAIQARHDFIAESDDDAAECAAFLISACGDVCSSCEVWIGTRLVTRTVAQPEPARFDLLAGRRQQQVIEMEDLLLQSRSHLAKSRRLIETLEAARKHRA